MEYREQREEGKEKSRRREAKTDFTQDSPVRV